MKLTSKLKPFGLFLVLSLMSIAGYSQDTYFTRNGYIKFFSHTPVEDILGQNYKVSSVLDTKTGKIEFAALIRAFEFEKKLMEEHFNENYLESVKFPKATFKGDIQNFDKAKLMASKGKQKVTVVGDLTIHGITKRVTVPGTIEVKEGKLEIASVFKVKPEDYNIKIPGAVRDKIAQELDVTVAMTLAGM